MRSAIWGLLLALPILACGDDDAVTTFDARATIDAPLPIGDAPIRDAPIAFDARPDANLGTAPTIRQVVITHAPGCSAGTSHNVTVDIIATDVETQPANLTYSGSCSSCGALTGRTTTFSCPELAPYNCSATVRDPEGNQAMTSFTISPCANTPDAGVP